VANNKRTACPINPKEQQFKIEVVGGIITFLNVASFDLFNNKIKIIEYKIKSL